MESLLSLESSCSILSIQTWRGSPLKLLREVEDVVEIVVPEFSDAHSLPESLEKELWKLEHEDPHPLLHERTRLQERVLGVGESAQP